MVLPQVEFREGFVQLRKEDPLRRCDNIQGDILSLCPRGKKGKSSACYVSRPACLYLSTFGNSLNFLAGEGSVILYASGW